jgi:hypothetical protein
MGNKVWLLYIDYGCDGTRNIGIYSTFEKMEEAGMKTEYPRGGYAGIGEAGWTYQEVEVDAENQF